MTLKKINILEYAFGEGGGGHQKAYAVYAFINVDNCERPLSNLTNTPNIDPNCLINEELFKINELNPIYQNNIVEIKEESLQICTVRQ